jgi:hypothetical protein
MGAHYGIDRLPDIDIARPRAISLFPVRTIAADRRIRARIHGIGRLDSLS